MHVQFLPISRILHDPSFVHSLPRPRMILHHALCLSIHFVTYLVSLAYTCMYPD